ncbi:hypothetical protein HYW54_05385 [Candidatus Gottesmanbacteria bacterium]|nr:hypothetical protein [Candidatus Gottesmanbacteria bacterium]
MAQLQFQKVDNEVFLIDIRLDGRRRWVGVSLKLEDIHKIRKFLQTP